MYFYDTIELLQKQFNLLLNHTQIWKTKLFYWFKRLDENEVKMKNKSDGKLKIMHVIKQPIH